MINDTNTRLHEAVVNIDFLGVKVVKKLLDCVLF